MLLLSLGKVWTESCLPVTTTYELFIFNPNALAFMRKGYPKACCDPTNTQQRKQANAVDGFDVRTRERAPVYLMQLLSMTFMKWLIKI